MLTSVAGFPTSSAGTGQSTISITPQSVGDIIIVAVRIGNTASTVSGLNGGGVTAWTKITGCELIDATDTKYIAAFWGEVTTPGVATLTLTFGGGTPTVSVDIVVDSFTAGDPTATWIIGQTGTVNGGGASATTIPYPTLSPAFGEPYQEVYWGYARGSGGSLAPAGTPNFSYYHSSGSGEVCTNLDVLAGTTYSPACTQATGGNYDSLGFTFYVVIPVTVSVPSGGISAPAATGSLILCDSAGNVLDDLEVDHTFRFAVSEAQSVTFQLGYDQAGASDLLSLLTNEIPRILAYRNGVLIFSGVWMPQQEVLQGDDQDGITCEFRTPFALQESRYLDTAYSYTQVDAASLAWELLSNRAHNDAVPTGLVLGVRQPTINVTRTYDAGTQISQAVTDLAAINNSFQFTESPLDPSTGDIAEINFYSDLGSDRSSFVQFEYGDRTLNNVLSVGRTISPPVNHSIATGGTAIATSFADDLGSQAAFGFYAVTNDYSNVQVQSHLDQLAAQAIQPNPVQEVTFEPDVQDASQPFDDYWLGDTVGFRAVESDITIVSTPQIHAIEIDRTADGIELAHRLEFGPVVTEPLTMERVKGRVRIRHARRTAGQRARLSGGGGSGLMSGKHTWHGMKPSQWYRPTGRHRPPGGRRPHSGSGHSG